MKALIVTESYFGNTWKVAEAIADGLRSAGAQAEVVDVGTDPDVDAVELLVVGAPTHNAGLPLPATRAQALEKGGDPERIGAREWLDALPRLVTCRTASFSTVTGPSAEAGTATEGIGRRLRDRKSDYEGAEDFLVLGLKGPLADGELDRARAWGASLA
ncbi:MAG: flavodoxin family protein [Cellulomonadaceae bacterium]